MDGYIRDFLEYLELEKGRSLKTIENYRYYLLRFAEHSGVKKPIAINEAAVRQFRMFLNRKGLSKKTINYHLIALRAFLKFLSKRNTESFAAEKVELARTSQRDIDIPQSADLDRLLASPGGSSLKALRDRAILELLFSTGLRVSELVSLNRESIDMQRGEFAVRGKGEKIRLVFLSKSAKDAVANYISKRGDIEEALFAGTQKKNPRRLTARQVERLVRHWATNAGIAGKVTPHTLRHMFATDLLMNGADLRSVQALLGHSSITTTQVYTHFTDKQLHEVHKAFHGKRRK